MANRESALNLQIRFRATAETPRYSAAEIARRVKNFIEVEMDAAEVQIEIDGSFLDYNEPYQAEKATRVRDPFAGNKRTDALN
jgi:hypothetical protein